jgi:tetratricopeptide (TPR) repeat protein
VAAFCAAASFDWVWQIGVVPIIAMLLIAVALGLRTDDRPAYDEPAARTAWRRWAPRVTLIGLALVGLWTIARPLATTQEVRASEAAATRGDFRAALSDAATARNIEPGAASPWLQRALLLEQLNDTNGAAMAIGQAERRESTNWRIWLVASRIAVEQNRPQAALAYYRRARRLNPTSPIFAG